MSWFKRKSAGIKTSSSGRNDVPDGQWIKCGGCSDTVNRREIEKQNLVCPKCDYHFKMSSMGYFDLLYDGDYEVHDDNLISVDPLGFKDRKAYADRIVATREKTGLNDAAKAAVGKIGGHSLSIAAMDFSFIGGSMGSVVGEVVTRAIRRGYEQKMPVLVIAQSGGARMMEGALSLMQMAKTSAHLTRLSEAGLPFIVLLTNPTTGGVTASFAMLGDFHIAEPGALIGFAGPRVIRETMGQDLPKGFQTSEFLLEKGFVDLIIDRRELRQELIHLLDLIMEEKVNVRKKKKTPAAK
ncbi:MAG: acetyl-CoA carboxylase, carboxyltransferase subunit beta [Bacteroidetes bacterium]|nr:acetyl-CoA carboxylase, carboxyltransferase subunit beta [Bacteroidota bacterium]MDA1333594.1 acetyl-CoA carboxylase, carboxyltransferase subunit beta [Bacteroidota bacterium]